MPIIDPCASISGYPCDMDELSTFYILFMLYAMRCDAQIRIDIVLLYRCITVKGDDWRCEYFGTTECKTCQELCSGQCIDNDDCIETMDDPSVPGTVVKRQGKCVTDPGSNYECKYCDYDAEITTEEPITSTDDGCECTRISDDSCKSWQRCLSTSPNGVCGECIDWCQSADKCYNSDECSGTGICIRSSTVNCGECDYNNTTTEVPNLTIDTVTTTDDGDKCDCNGVCEYNQYCSRTSNVAPDICECVDYCPLDDECFNDKDCNDNTNPSTGIMYCNRVS